MLQVLINGEEFLCDKNITIKEDFLSPSSTILNNCYPKSWEENRDYLTEFFYVKDYSKCEIYYDNELLFAGVVKNSGNISLNPRQPHFASFQVLDYKTFLSEGTTLDFVIANKTVTEAINMVVDAISDYGFVVGIISLDNASQIIEAYSTLDKSAYDVFQYLSNITQSRWYTRRVNNDTIAIDFYSIDLMNVANTIEYTEEYFENNNIQDISYSFNTGDYRNKQTILSDEVYASINTIETKYANGYNTEFTTEQKIGKINSIFVNDVEKIVITSEEKELGIDGDFYYTVGSQSFNSLSALNQGDKVQINYVSLVKGREVIYNSGEVNRIKSQTNRNGIISRYEKRNDSTSSKELQAIAQTYLKFKGKAEIILKIVTFNKDILNIGDQVKFNAPISELVSNYMVKSKEIQIIQSNDEQFLFYTYSLSNSYNSELPVNYFDNQRAKNTGNISQGSFITRNIDISHNCTLFFSDLTITEIPINSNNVLNAPLNAPFMQ